MTDTIVPINRLSDHRDIRFLIKFAAIEERWHGVGLLFMFDLCLDE